MTKLFQRFNLARKTQQTRLSSSSISSNSSSIRMESTRPASIYLNNKSSRRSGVHKYTCSPRLSLYLQEMKEGPQLRHQERRVLRHSSFSLGQHDHSSVLKDLHQVTSEAFVDRRSSLKRTLNTRAMGLKDSSYSSRNKFQPRFDMGDYLDDNEFSLSMFQNN